MRVFCWGGEEGRSGCFGDSGSPLTVEVEGRAVLAGSVSGGSGPGCGAAGTFGLAWEAALYKAGSRHCLPGDTQTTFSILKSDIV